MNRLLWCAPGVTKNSWQTMDCALRRQLWASVSGHVAPDQGGHQAAGAPGRRVCRRQRRPARSRGRPQQVRSSARRCDFAARPACPSMQALRGNQRPSVLTYMHVPGCGLPKGVTCAYHFRRTSECCVCRACGVDCRKRLVQYSTRAPEKQRCRELVPGSVLSAC